MGLSIWKRAQNISRKSTYLTPVTHTMSVCQGVRNTDFSEDFFVRNKWMIPSFIYRVGNLYMLQFSNQSSIPIYPENISKTSGFLMFSGGVETEH